MKLKREFYKLSALELAPKLLGKFLCRKIDDVEIKLRIIETECYCGEEDTACHAHKGKTQRTKILYEEGGCAYIYLCYGIHNLLNVVTGEKEHPEAVLIRGVEGYQGPGKLTKALQIDRSLNGEIFYLSNELWIEDDGYTPEFEASRRIGIDYASEEYRDKLWRFSVK